MSDNNDKSPQPSVIAVSTIAVNTPSPVPISEVTPSIPFVDRGGSVKQNVLGRSEVWKFFRIYNEKPYKMHALCVLCNTDVFYGATHCTGNLSRHMERKHRKEFDLLQSQKESKRQRLLSSASGTSNGCITNFTSNCTGFEECLVKWMIKTYQPLSAVQEDTFRDMLTSLNKKVPAVSYGKIRSLMTQKYHETLYSIKKILKGKDVSLTTDAWTSVARDGYVTCTLHFVEPKSWTLHNFSLGLFKKNGTSTAIDVVRYAEEHLNNFEISYTQLTCVVTDTESTMVAAGRLFKEKSVQEGGETAWHGCVDHVLELVTKLAFRDIPDSIGTLSACRSIVNYFKSSTQANLKLKEKSKARLGMALSVVQDVCTRWWSTYTMCERLYRLKDVLTIMSLEGDLRSTLSDAQWVVVWDLIVLLKPFMIAQKLLEGESYVTISLIPYMLYKIRSSLEAANVNPGSSAQVKSISLLMLAKFREEFGSGLETTVATDHLVEGNRRRAVGIPKIVLMAMYLDPRTKSAVGIPPADRDLIWQDLKSVLTELAVSIGPLTPCPGLVGDDMAGVVNQHNGRQRNNEMAEFFDEIEQEAEVDAEEVPDDLLQELYDDMNPMPGMNNNGQAVPWTPERARLVVHAEVDHYKSGNGIPMIESSGKFACPLTWWRQHENDFPYLSKLAAKYLSIPATSAPAERVFSTAGLTIAKDRARLDPDRANELVFMHDSIPALDQYKLAVPGE